MTTYSLEITLENDKYCDGCFALDTMMSNRPFCKNGEFWMESKRVKVNENGPIEWRTVRPKGCPLKPVEGK